MESTSGQAGLCMRVSGDATCPQGLADTPGRMVNRTRAGFAMVGGTA